MCEKIEDKTPLVIDNFKADIKTFIKKIAETYHLKVEDAEDEIINVILSNMIMKENCY